MNIHKEDTHSVFPKYFQARGAHHLAVTIMGAFALDKSEELLDETDLWAAAGEALSAHEVLDMFMPKQNGEFLAAGKFFSPGGRPVPAGRVRISVGSVNKELHVFGDRNWITKAGIAVGISEPQPITTMEIAYGNAFGGPGFTRNPLGKGMQPSGPDGVLPLPNIEYPDQHIGAPSDRPKPAGFGPLGSDWQPRAGKLGTYDRTWFETRWPWYPEDMDWTYFNAAPEDQIIDGYFRGDENVVIEYMHPAHMKIEAKLPGLRMRCFIEMHGAGKEIFNEVNTRLDTVWLFPAQGVGVLIWRATTAVTDEDATDISAIVIGHEMNADEEKPVEYYRQLLYQEEMEKPGRLEPTEEAVTEARDQPEQPRVPEQESDPEIEAMIRKLEDEITASEQALMNELKDKGIDLAQLMKELPVMTGVPVEEPPALPAELSLSQLEKDLAQGETELGKMLTKLGFDPNVRVELPTHKGQAEPPSAKEFIESMRKAGISDPETEQYLLELETGHEEAEKKLAALLEEEETQDAAREKEKAAAADVQEPVAPELEEVFTREKVVEWYAAGRDFAGKDLSGLDLSGLDLNGIDMQRALLENVNFTRTNLAGADLSKAVMTGAVLDRAYFRSSQMTGCILNAASGRDADMSHADLEGADLTGSAFDGASFIETRLDYALFEESRLKGAHFRHASARWAEFNAADLTEADFHEADVSSADFSEAVMQNTGFSEALAHAATFDGATGHYVTFRDADLRQSRADETTCLERTNFQNTDLSEANWGGADLTSSIFRYATLTMADFSGCNLLGTDFYRTVARKAKFSSANLTDANMTSINLFRGDMTKATLVRTDLKGSNLFEVEFLKAKVVKASFKDANLKRTKLAGWVPK